MADIPEPPTARYRLTLTIEGNTLDEVEREIVIQTRGGFLLDSDGYKRDEWNVIGGRAQRVMEHRNPDMTPERYDAELDAWSEARRFIRRNSEPGGSDHG